MSELRIAARIRFSKTEDATQPNIGEEADCENAACLFAARDHTADSNVKY